MNENDVVSVGIDVGKAKLDVAWLRADKTVLHAIFSNDKKGIVGLARMLRKERVGSAVPCVLEATGDYHLLAALQLSEAGYAIKCINPLITTKYRRSTVRDAKTDKIDCARLAHIAVMEPELAAFQDTRETIAAKKLVASIAHLETLRQRLSAHLQLLKETSEALGIKASHRDAERAVVSIERQIAAYRSQVCAAAPEGARAIAEAMPGVSREQVAVLLVALGDKAFENRDQLVAFVGMDVRTRQSGSWRGKETLSKRGNGYLRKVLFQIGWGLMMNHPEYRKAYDRMRERGKNYKTCILALARKFLRFLFACHWKRTVELAPKPASPQIPSPVATGPSFGSA